MTRRHAFRDPTAVGALSTATGADVADLLATLPDYQRDVIERYFGLRDGAPWTTAQIANATGQFENSVRFHLSLAMQALEAGRSGVSPLDGDLSSGVLDRERPLTDLAFCERHGWTIEVVDAQRCAACRCGVGSQKRGGRGRKYCSAACRQAAYRSRSSIGVCGMPSSRYYGPLGTKPNAPYHSSRYDCASIRTGRAQRSSAEVISARLWPRPRACGAVTTRPTISAPGSFRTRRYDTTSSSSAIQACHVVGSRSRPSRSW
jgi:hypothetical protein